MDSTGTDDIAGDDPDDGDRIPNDLTLENRENAPQTTILYRLQIGEVVSTIPSELDWRSLIPVPSASVLGNTPRLGLGYRLPSPLLGARSSSLSSPTIRSISRLVSRYDASLADLPYLRFSHLPTLDPRDPSS